MPSRRIVKRVRCVQCGKLAASTVMGQCPRCVTVETALAASDWKAFTSLRRSVTRRDGDRLVLAIAKDGELWSLSAIERRPREAISHAEISAFATLIDAVREGDHFARRWLEKAPGTSIATFAPKPPS